MPTILWARCRSCHSAPPKSRRDTKDGDDGIPTDLGASTDKGGGNFGAKASAQKVLVRTMM